MFTVPAGTTASPWRRDAGVEVEIAASRFRVAATTDVRADPASEFNARLLATRRITGPTT